MSEISKDNLEYLIKNTVYCVPIPVSDGYIASVDVKDMASEILTLRARVEGLVSLSASHQREIEGLGYKLGDCQSRAAAAEAKVKELIEAGNILHDTVVSLKGDGWHMTETWCSLVAKINQEGGKG